MPSVATNDWTGWANDTVVLLSWLELVAEQALRATRRAVGDQLGEGDVRAAVDDGNSWSPKRDGLVSRAIAGN